MCDEKHCEKDKCRIAVTVEDDFAPCTYPENRFDIVIRSRDGCETACGKVSGGSSAVFELPCKEHCCEHKHDCDCDCDCDCGREYTVTVSGGEYSSPRAQTRRVRCCCGETAGVTFIFMTFEPCCEEQECCCPPPPPCCCEHKPPKPPKPKPPKPHKPPKSEEEPDTTVDSPSGECECKEE